MGTSKSFDVIFPLTKTLTATLEGFPEVDSAFSLLALPFDLSIADSGIRINDDMFASIVSLYLSHVIDETKLKLRLKTSLDIALLESFTIQTTLSSREAISSIVGIPAIRTVISFWERLPIVASVPIGKIGMIASATVGTWRRLFNWDYDDTPQEFPILYWDTKLLSALDYKEGEEYL